MTDLFSTPPSADKVPLARLMAISAVFSGFKDIREVVSKAEMLRDTSGWRTVLFVDEVHRFNKVVKYFINQRLIKSFVQFFVLPHCSVGVKHG